MPNIFNYKQWGERIFEATEPMPSFSQNPNGTEKSSEDDLEFFKYYGGNSGNLESLIGKTVQVFREGPILENPAYMHNKNIFASFVVKQVKRGNTNTITLGSETKPKVNPKTKQEEMAIDASKPFIVITDSTAPTITYYTDYENKEKVYNTALQNYVMMKAFNKQQSKQ